MTKIRIDELKSKSMFKCYPNYLEALFNVREYPWEALIDLDKYIMNIINNELPQGFIRFSSNVIIGHNTTISDQATINGPAIIGSNCEIRPGAYIRGNVITGHWCIIGNSTELKNCILLDEVQVPHYNYVGDSILGNRTHLGASSLCSNVKSDKNTVTISFDKKIETGMNKLGAILSDDVEVGCGSVLNPGTIILEGSRIYPLTSVRGIIPPKHIVKSANSIVPII
jgi:NDP-sugar pyrophosphorylase family protein